MQMEATARVMFGIELVKEAVKHIPACGVRFDTMWMQMNMEMMNPGSDFAAISVTFLVYPDVPLRATGNVRRHNGVWSEGDLTITLPDDSAWLVHGYAKCGIMMIDEVKPA